MDKTIQITKHETQDTKVGTKHYVYDDKTKYEFFEKKKDGGLTKAYEQWKQFEIGVGAKVLAEVAEEPESFKNKDGETVKFTRRKIIYFKGDEYNVPYQVGLEKSATGTFKGDVDIEWIKGIEERVADLEAVVFKAVEDGPKGEDLPF